MNEQERDDFIKKIGISADDSNESDDEEEENDPEHHKYNCKKCQVSSVLPACTHHLLLSWVKCLLNRFNYGGTDGSSSSVSLAVICKRQRVPEAYHGAAQGARLRLHDL